MRKQFYSILSCLGIFLASGQTPEVLYYKFDNTGTTVPNLALNPPTGAATATIMGNLTIVPNTTCLGNGLVGTSSTGASNYLNTNWNLQLSGSWTMHMKFNNYTSTDNTVYYLLGDQATGGSSFRLFTNGAPGPNNIRLTGNGITNVNIPGVFPANSGLTDLIIIYDSTQQHVRAYVNGVLTVTVAQANPLNINGAIFRIGGYGSSTGMKNGMIIDEFGLFNRAVTDTEIASLTAYCSLNTVEIQTSKRQRVVVKENNLILEKGNFGNYQILDRSGRSVQTGTEKGNSIDVTMLPSGIYMVNFKDITLKFRK